MDGSRTPELIRVLIVICLSVPVGKTVPGVLPGRCECARDSSWNAGDQQKQCSPLPWVLHSLGKAVASAHTEGFTKVILDKYNEILGAHIIGPDVTNLITEYSIAMCIELTADEIIETIHPYLTLSEGLREAVLAAEGRPIPFPPKQVARAR